MKTAKVYRMGGLHNPSRWKQGDFALSLSQDFDKVRPREPSGRRVQGRVGAIYASPSPEGVLPWVVNYLTTHLSSETYYKNRRKLYPSWGRLEGSSFCPLFLKLTVPASVPVYSVEKYLNHQAENYWENSVPLALWQREVAQGGNPHHLELDFPGDDAFSSIHYAECLLRPEEILAQDRFTLAEVAPLARGEEKETLEELFATHPQLYSY